jgi:SpoVK/Ycf46/Vps4 family AAA+-type ATPase
MAMVKRAASHASWRTPTGATAWLSPDLSAAPVLDLLCTHFVLSLVQQQGGKFSVRRDLGSLMMLVGRHLVWPDAVLQRLRAFLQRRCADNELWQEQGELGHGAFLEKYGTWRGPYEEGTLFFYLDEYAKDAPKDLLATLATTAKWLSHALKKQSTLVEKNIDALAGLLQLNRAERALLLYGTLARYQRDLRSLLVEFKVNNAPEAYASLGEVAGVPGDEVAEALRAGSRLERIGLVENLISEHNITDLADLMKVSEKLPPVLMREYRDESELMAVFTRPAAPTALTRAHFHFVADEVDVLATLLRQAIATRSAGVNVLLYGPPGTGKTELAKVLATQAGADLYEVEYADRDGNSLTGRDRYRSLQIAQVFLKGAQSAALLFDEVEDVFPPISLDAAAFMARADQQMLPPSGGNHSVNGKAWVNQILESNPVPTIWVTNQIEQIDPAFRRRFAYHLELKSPPPGAREQLVRSALDGAAVSDAFVARLAERKGLTPAQIRTAVRFATLALAPADAPDEAGSEQGAAAVEAFEALISRQLAHADQALGTPGEAKGRPAVTTYQLTMLNVDSRYEIPRIIEALKARGHGTLCFYGAPGTGKTALAEHIAQQLQKPLIIKRASDLLSKFIGETERNMAAMFAEAEAEKAVLLLDEADSFLQDRRGAQRNYEVTEVNEMLQGMERFSGIFICTTNLLDRIDQAALRRFTFKITFKPLKAEQREQMFIAEALGGDAEGLTEPLRQRLRLLDQLCPGDFAAVKRQGDILGEALAPEEFVAQLEAEHRIKPEVREQRRIGFA